MRSETLAVACLGTNLLLSVFAPASELRRPERMQKEHKADSVCQGNVFAAYTEEASEKRSQRLLALPVLEPGRYCQAALLISELQ